MQLFFYITSQSLLQRKVYKKRTGTEPLIRALDQVTQTLSEPEPLAQTSSSTQTDISKDQCTQTGSEPLTQTSAPSQHEVSQHQSTQTTPESEHLAKTSTTTQHQGSQDQCTQTVSEPLAQTSISTQSDISQDQGTQVVSEPDSLAQTSASSQREVGQNQPDLKEMEKALSGQTAAIRVSIRGLAFDLFEPGQSVKKNPRLLARLCHNKRKGQEQDALLQMAGLANIEKVLIRANFSRLR